MGFLKHIRSRSKLKNQQQPEAQVYGYKSPPKQQYYSSKPTAAGYLPARALDTIFAYLAPHTLDESYLSCEDSMADDGCTLCNTRDLAHCAGVNRNWANAAERRLYHSVRLDTVHYCEREIELSEKRKHKRKFDRNGEPGDPTQQRLKLFSETARSNEYLASLVCLLKMPYMARESCKADLARTVSVLFNLRFVDLPDGFYSDDHSTITLRQELQIRCPEIRKMKYLGGAETSFTQLAHSRMWQNMESLELTGLNLEADVLLYVLASFPALRNIKIGGDMSCLVDDVFTFNPSLPPFPPLTRLSLYHAPGVTARGLVNYLSRPETREVLASLELSTTGVAAHELYQVLATAPYLTHLSYSETVSKAFPISPVPPMACNSLQNFAFEILPEHHSANPVSETYYNYLASSLLSGSMPSLKECYAYSPSLPDLLFSPPLPPFGAPGMGNGGGRPNSAYDPTSQVLSSRFSTLSTNSSRSDNRSTSSFHQSSSSFHAPNFAPPATMRRAVPAGLRSPLSLFTKSPAAPELEWSLTTIEPPSERNGRRGSASATRPLSLVMNERSSSPARSMVGNGLGGFLAVPGDEGGIGGAGGRESYYGGKSSGHGTDTLLSPKGHNFGHSRRPSKVGVGMGEWMG